MSDPAKVKAISEAALKIFTDAELRAMSEQTRLSLLHLISKRLDKEPPPTLDELVGIKEMVMEYFYHPAVEKISKSLPPLPSSDQTSGS